MRGNLRHTVEKLTILFNEGHQKFKKLLVDFIIEQLTIVERELRNEEFKSIINHPSCAYQSMVQLLARSPVDISLELTENLIENFYKSHIKSNYGDNDFHAALMLYVGINFELFSDCQKRLFRSLEKVTDVMRNSKDPDQIALVKSQAEIWNKHLRLINEAWEKVMKKNDK